MSAARSRADHEPADVRPWLGSALVAAATCAALLALTHLIQPGAWLRVACLSVLLLAAVVGGVRALTRSAWLPSLVGGLVALVGLVLRYGAPSGGGAQVLPTLAAARRTWVLAGEGITAIQASLVPMPPGRSAELLVVAGAVAVLLLVDALALGAGVPALAALPLITLWVPAVVLGYPASGWAVLWTALAYLMLLALSTAPRETPADRVRRSTTVLASAAGVVALALVAAPAVAALPGWSSVRLPSFGTGPGGPLVLSDNLDLRDSLGSRSAQVVLRYTVSHAQPPDGGPGGPTPAATSTAPSSVGPLRAFTLSTFDGRGWSRSGVDQVFPFDPGSWLGADGSVLDPASELDVQVQVESLSETRLPISTFPRTVSIDGSWSYDPQRDEVVGSQATTAGQTYTMQVAVQNLTAAELSAAGIGQPPGGEDYLQVPTTQHLADITARAHQVVGDAATAYDKAMALQQYFRSGANFVYDPKVPPATSQDAVWDFLQSRHGYCVQFASAMTMMARILGIPARVAVGFLPGTATGNPGEYAVSGKDAHAWPELYFAGYGWVRFEPTPAVQTGAPPAWSDPVVNAAGSGAQNPNDLGRAGQATGGAATAAPTTAPLSTGTGTVRSSWVPTAITVGLVLLVTAAALLVWWRHYRRPAELNAERAWHTLRGRLAKRRITWSDATTPRGAIRAVQDALVERTGAQLDGSALEALTRLARTVEAERYAPAHTTSTSSQLHHLLATVLTGVDELVSDRSRRDAAPSAPPAGP